VVQLNPNIASNPLFLPTYPGKSFAYVQSLDEEKPRYSNLLDLLPSDYDNKAVHIRFLGNPGPRDDGRLRLYDEDIPFGGFKNGLIDASLNLLYDRLQMNLGSDAEDFTFRYKSKTVGDKLEPLRVGSRFFSTYITLRKEDLVYLVFILYLLQGNIVTQ
jgi:hypothetical protein